MVCVCVILLTRRIIYDGFGVNGKCLDTNHCWLKNSLRNKPFRKIKVKAMNVITDHERGLLSTLKCTNKTSPYALFCDAVN